jgi:hypothetical protein
MNFITNFNYYKKVKIFIIFMHGFIYIVYAVKVITKCDISHNWIDNKIKRSISNYLSATLLGQA